MSVHYKPDLINNTPLNHNQFIEYMIGKAPDSRCQNKK
ncbi:hypothetical protein BTN49_2736 [Candidatus Enterovibrio escicola]|uniref:Uncharacterized protein n=1 Tax=Candidatus Enterovibrio escicola TaxID=1927127 RepID=A0A2A5T0N6_9GAMM|nr:hypothetical protein BTN49_2736 [Candidatus Enterovibrio escacola]